MIHRLKNWMFARDLMCSQPEMIADIISRILRSSPSGEGMDISSIEYNNILLMVKSCGRVISQDGLEASLTIWSQTLSVELTGDKFDEFLKRLDDVLGEMVIGIGRNHNF